MKNSIKKILVVASVTAVLGGTSTAYAANTFHFSFHTQVIGKKEFNLKNKQTYCDSTAATYNYNTNRCTGDSKHYHIDLDGNNFWNPDYDGKNQKADGYSHRTYYNKQKKISENTYTVNVGSKDDLVAMCLQITGKGTLMQK